MTQRNPKRRLLLLKTRPRPGEADAIAAENAAKAREADAIAAENAAKARESEAVEAEAPFKVFFLSFFPFPFSFLLFPPPLSLTHSLLGCSS